MFDCHVHSCFSGDSEMIPEVACDKAMDLGLDGIAFTDHLDLDYPDYNDQFNIDFNKYSSFFDSLKHDYNNKLMVLKGIEVGIQPHVIESTEKIVEAYDFDFVIASTHIIDRMDPYNGTFYKGKTKTEAFELYLKEILHAVQNFKNYDVVGHIGYIRRYGSYDDNTLRYIDYKDIIDEIFKTIINDGKGIEINTSGCRTLGSPIPDFDIVKRYKELGGETITIGSDAHFPEHIASEFKVVTKRLSELGFKYLAHFEKRKAVFEKI